MLRNVFSRRQDPENPDIPEEESSATDGLAFGISLVVTVVALGIGLYMLAGWYTGWK